MSYYLFLIRIRTSVGKIYDQIGTIYAARVLSCEESDAVKYFVEVSHHDMPTHNVWVCRLSIKLY